VWARAEGKNKRKGKGGDAGGGSAKKGKMSAEDEAALKKRAERFKAAPVDPEEEVRRKARAARFGGAA
jgi:hypothetical protein